MLAITGRRPWLQEAQSLPQRQVGQLVQGITSVQGSGSWGVALLSPQQPF